MTPLTLPLSKALTSPLSRPLSGLFGNGGVVLMFDGNILMFDGNILTL